MDQTQTKKMDKGFRVMDKAEQKVIASKGGVAAHKKGTAHEWTQDEAREAGRKGGYASAASKTRKRLNTPATPAAPAIMDGEIVDPQAGPKNAPML